MKIISLFWFQVLLFVYREFSLVSFESVCRTLPLFSSSINVEYQLCTSWIYFPRRMETCDFWIRQGETESEREKKEKQIDFSSLWHFDLDNLRIRFNTIARIDFNLLRAKWIKTKKNFHWNGNSHRSKILKHDEWTALESLSNKWQNHKQKQYFMILWKVNLYNAYICKRLIKFRYFITLFRSIIFTM